MSTARKPTFGWRKEYRRRLALEALEHRLLLAISPAPIDSSQRQCLEDGLDGLVDWAHTLDQYGAVAQVLPAVGLPLGQSLDLSDVLDQRLVTPVKNYFLADTTPTTAELVTTLQGLGGTIGNLTITVPGTVVGGLDDQGGYQELIFSLLFQGNRSLTSRVSLGPKGEELGFAFDAAITVPLSASANLDFSFGMDLTSGLDPEDAFFIRVNDLDASASASGTGLAGAMNAGFYAAQLTSGTVALNASLDVALSNPDSDPHGSITLEELESTSLSSLVTLTPTGSASGSLSVSASPFAGFTPGGSLSVSFTSTNPFQTPDLSFSAGFDELLNFANINSHSLLGVLSQWGGWLDALRDTSVMDTALHLAGEANLGDALDLGSMITDANGLIGLLTDAEDQPLFTSAQQLETELVTALGLSQGDIAATYNSITNELTYEILIDYTFVDKTFSFGTDLDLGSLVDLSSSATVNVAADGRLQFTIGLDLSGLSAELAASAAGPSNGQLSDDAEFQLSVDFSAPVAVVVAKADTDDNATLNDLADDVQDALAVAGLGSWVAAGVNGSRLTLTTMDRGIISALRLDAESGDPALTEMHFEDGKLAMDSVARHAFVEDVSVEGSAALDVLNLDASAGLGFLQVAVVDGTASADFSIAMALKEPGASEPGGRIYVSDLFPTPGGTLDEITDLVATPTIGGSLSLALPLEVTPDIFGLNASGNPAVALNWSDITDPQTLDLQFNDADLLLSFENLDSTTIVAAFVDVVDYLSTLEGYSFLNERLPGVNRSIAEMAEFAGYFAGLVADLENDPAGVLQELEAKIEEAFGLEDSAVELSLTESNTVLSVEIVLQRTVERQYAVDVDLDGLGLGSFGNLVEFAGAGQLSAEVGGVLSLGFGIDLSDPETPLPFLYEGTGLGLTAKVLGTDINFTTAVGPLGVWIKDGSVTIDCDGEPGTPEPVLLALTLEDPDLDDKIYLSELDFDLVDLSLTGQVAVVLPVCFPTESNLLDPPISLTITDLEDIPGTIDLTAPDFEDAVTEFDLLNNLGVIVDGVDYVLSGVQDVMQSRVFSHNWPMIGDKLADAADFIQDIRDGVIENLRNRFAEAMNKTSVVVQQAIFDALGPGGLNLLLDGDANGSVTRDDISVTLTDNDVDGQADDQIDIQMALGKAYTLVDVPIDFDIGIPALGLDVDGNVQLELGFQWAVAIGISRDDGFYFDTSPVGEVMVYVVARTPDLQAEGDLLFFQLDVTDEDADDDPNNTGVDVDQDGLYPSQLALAITVDLLDPFSDGKLTFGDLTNLSNLTQLIDVSVDGSALVNLGLVVSFDGDARFPSIEADFQLDWVFSPTDPDLNGGLPAIAFNNVRLNLGEFFSDFASPVLKEIQKVTVPLQPIIDFITEPVPLLDDFGLEVTVLDVVEAFGYGEVADFVGAVAGVIDVINSIPVVNGDVYVPLGSFNLGAFDPLPEEGEPPEDLNDVTPNTTVTVDPVQEMQEDDDLWSVVGDFFGDLDSLGIAIPIIAEPMKIFQLLLGQDVDLITYDMPEFSLNLQFPLGKIGPLIPPIPIFASFNAEIEMGVDLAFGFDTHGFRTFQETRDWWDIFSGFYISDRENADGTGRDTPEGWLSGTINGGVELGLVVVAAGVSGGITTSLYANLNDPNGDGKVYLDEFLANLDLGLMSTFDVYGDIKFHLEAYVELLFKRWEFTLAEVTLVEFELTTEEIYHDRYSGNDTQGSSTYVGVAPGIHVDGLSLEGAGDADWYGFELLRPDSVDVDVRYSDVHGDVNIIVYDHTGTVELGRSQTDRDREVVSLVDLPAGTYFAKVTGAGRLNNYMFCVEPGETSTTRVIYINPGSKEDRGNSFYTLEPGDNDNDGLCARKPKASLQSVLATYDLGPNDLVVFDTGDHVGGATIAAEDGGATYVGSVAGSAVSGITLSNSDNSRFYNLNLSNGGTGLTIAGTSTGNLVHYCHFSENNVGLRIDSPAPNLIEHNTLAGNDAEGIHLSPGVTSTVRDNDISGSAIGVYCDSKVADFYRNAIHGNTVGLQSERGILGPDNPPPYGASGGKEPNEVYGNETGVLIPASASGVIVRFNDIHDNTEVGIAQLGDGSLIIANDIYRNPIGIRGTRVIGPADWGSELDNRIHNNTTGVLALAGAEVRFNRIYSNTTGIEVERNALIHHNLIYRNGDHGVFLAGAEEYEDRKTEGANSVQVLNNTIYAPGGNGIHMEDFVSAITIENNIVWAESGYALYVEDKSQFGYSSDYNNLYTNGTGMVAFQGKAFFDLYDWQVEAESDLHSIGYTTVDPALDDPQFVDAGQDDYHLQSDSTSIDAGDPAGSYNLEPAPNGNRINLGAYGNTPDATASPAYWLRITYPRYYVDLVPSRTYPIRWESYNIAGSAALDIDLVYADGTKAADITTTTVGAGQASWKPQDVGISGNPTSRYRIKATATVGFAVVDTSREAFSIPAIDPDAANTFYVDDRDAANSNDEYTPTAAGDNRNTGTTAEDPKVVIRPIVLSYDVGPGDAILVDTGSYIHAVNLDLSAQPIPLDPRMNTFTGARIDGPTGADKLAQIDRANPWPGSRAIDMMDVDNSALRYLTIVGAEIGVHVRQGSTSLTVLRDTFAYHTLDGIRVEGASHGARFDDCVFSDNGRHGVFVDSLLVHIFTSKAHDNGQIGMALRSVGTTYVQQSEAYNNLTGIDVINPGPGLALIGDSNANLATDLGNLVHHNSQDGIFASGNVLVAGSSVWENMRTGIRLEDGADAERNVVRTHTNGIDASGSASNILENRVMNNSDTAILASFDSMVERNVVYTNAQHGIHVDHFSGTIDHNLVYETGNTSIWVEGPGTGAQLINNTVYEPCVESEPEEEETTVTLTWQWQINLTEFSPPMICPVVLEGAAEIRYSQPIGLGFGGTFELGPGGGPYAETVQPVPGDGQEWFIPAEIVSLDLRSLGETDFGPIDLHLSSYEPDSTPPLENGILVRNEGGTLVGHSTLSFFVDVYLQDPRLTLYQLQPMTVTRTFGATSGINEYQSLQLPLTDWTFSSPAPLAANAAAEVPDGQWYPVHVTPTPHPPATPQNPGRYCAEYGVHVSTSSSHVLLRNNAVYVEGCRHMGPLSRDIAVEADSQNAWQSDFNIFTTKKGLIGRWGATDTPTLSDWKTASRDDFFSIDPPPEIIWVDPDGNDNLLGFRAPGAADGRDDNLHLRSPFGEVAQGALAPVEDFTSLAPNQLPEWQAVNWQQDPPPQDEKNLSPGVDWGDPTYAYGAELLENGRFINLGCYGNTSQASLSEPEYVHMVYPLGREELVWGQTYNIQWRSQDNVGPFTIELRHGNEFGPLEMTIATGVANSGSYLWAVPPPLPPPAPQPPAVNNDYVIVVKRAKAVPPPSEVVGTSRRLIFVNSTDTVAPSVLQATPQIVDYELPTNAPVSSISLTFSENLLAAMASNPACYELRGAGPNGTFNDAGDSLWWPAVVYTAGAAASDTSRVDLNLGAALPPDKYRLTVFGTGGSILTDSAGNALDGDDDGTAGGDYVRQFIVDQTPPTVSITSVGASPRNDSVDQITIVFSEEVRGLGLADLRLTCSGGANLLTEANILTTADGITWTLPGLTGITAGEGSYRLDLTPANGDIRDLAGNPLAMTASTNWSTETTRPTVQITAVAPDPRGQGVSQITLVFSEPVTNFDLADLSLSRDGGSNLLTSSQVLATSDSVTWTVSDLTTLTASGGTYALALGAAASGITDLVGNALAADAQEVWQVDTTPPEADVLDADPNPRHTAIDQIVIAFNEPVTGVGLADLALTRDGGSNLLTVSETLTSVDGMNWTLGGLTDLTHQAGQYTLTLTAVGSGIQDASGNLLAQNASDAWLVDGTPPTVAITAVAPDLRPTAVESITIEFSEAVTGFDLADLVLTRDSGSNLLTGDETLTTSDNIEWVLGNLATLTAVDGEYELVLTAAGSGIQDAAGSPLSGSASQSWLMDGTVPTVEISAVTPDPRFAAVSQLDIVFSEPVEEFDLADLVLMRNGGSNLLTGSSATLTTTDDVTWTLGNLSGLTGTVGLYALILAAPYSRIADTAGNLLARGDIETWVYESDTVSITATAGVQFSERVATFCDPWSPGSPTDPEDFHAVIDWGDSSTFAGTVRILDGDPASFEVLGTHTYTRFSAYRTVDSEVDDGPMGFTVTGSSHDLSMTHWTIELTAEYTPTEEDAPTLRDVHFVLPFVWDASVSPMGAMAWNNAARCWKLGAKTFTAWGVEGPNEWMTMDRDMVDTPISWPKPGRNTATVQPTDSLLAVGLGDFSPNDSKIFNLSIVLSPEFFGFIPAGFFVAARKSAQYDVTVTVTKPSLPGESRVLDTAATVVPPDVAAWDGQQDNGAASADANWQTGANWSGDAAPQAGDALLFLSDAAQSSKSNINNFPTETAFHSLAFSGGGYSITGNAIGLAAGIVNKATAAAGNVLDLGIRLDAPQNFQNLSISTLTISGTVDTNGNRLTIDGPGPITLSGAISGSGSLEKKGAGTTTLSGANTYQGGTTVTGGIFEVNSAGALPAGRSLTIGAGGTVVLASGLGVAGTTAATSAAIAGSVSLTASVPLAPGIFATPDSKTAALPQSASPEPSVPYSGGESTAPGGTPGRVRPGVPLRATMSRGSVLELGLDQMAPHLLAWLWDVAQLSGRGRAPKSRDPVAMAVDEVLARYVQ